MAERLIKSLKMMIFRHLTHTKTKRWLDILPKVVDSYNSRVHRVIGCAPNSVTPANEREFMDRIYGKQEKPIYKFKIGQKVRIKAHKSILDKGYTQTFTEKKYVIAERVPQRYPAVYLIETEEGLPIRGVWYTEELVNAGEEDGLLRTPRVQFYGVSR